MGKTITTKKSELCWLYHEYTWTEKNYNNWKNWLVGIAEKHNWLITEDKYWTACNIALAKLIQNLEWDEVATRFEKDDDLLYEFETKGCNGGKHTVSLNKSLADAMGEDAWDADYEISDACDTDTDYEFNEIEEEDE